MTGELEDPTLREPFPLDASAWGECCREVADRQRREVEHRSRRLQAMTDLVAELEAENARLRRELAELRARKLDRVDELILGGPSIGEE